MYDFKSRCYFFSEIMNRTKVFFFFKNPRGTVFKA